MIATPTTTAEDTILAATIQGRQALEACAQRAGDSPRLDGPPDALAGLVLAQAEEVAAGLCAGDAAQALVDALALLLAIGEDHVGAEAIRATRP